MSYWKELPDEVWRRILQSLSLPQLRLVKTVSNDMANHCRCVLRGEDWQKWGANGYALECEVATQATRSYSFPMDVCFYEEQLMGPYLTATIHRLKLKVETASGQFPDPNIPSTWTRDVLEKCVVHVVDMLIDVHGRGICGSEYALRSVIAEEMKKRAFCRTGYESREWFASSVCNTIIHQYEARDDDGNDEGWYEVDDSCCGEVDLWKLLQETVLVTNTGGGPGWTLHRATHQNQHGREQRWVDLLCACTEAPGLLT